MQGTAQHFATKTSRTLEQMQGTAQRQTGLWPSSNQSVAAFKRQDVTVEERVRMDIRNEKRARKRPKRDR